MYNMFLHVSVALLLGSFCSASTISNPREDHEFQCSIDVYLREECNISTTNELECLSSGCCFSDDPYDAVKCYKKRKDTMTIKCEVQESSRKDCGYGGITPTRCEDLGCCFEASNMAGVPWCFYAKEEKNEKEESTKELKTSLINKFKSGLDSIFEQESLKPDTDNKVTSEEGVSDWLENLLDQISTITTGPVESPENFYGRPGEEINPKMVEDEKACMKTYELLLSVNGQFECEIYPIRRVECISGGLRLREDESECTACTKLGCCYDPEMKGSGTPHCYRGRPIVVSSALPTTTTTPAPTTNPRWSMLLNQLGIRPEESSASRNPFTTQNKSLWNQGQSSPWSQTSNLQPPVNFPGANQLQGAGSFEESLFHQINSQNGIGSSNNNFLNGLKPIQGNGITSNNVKSILNALNPVQSTGAFTNTDNTNTGSILSALRPVNNNGGLSGILSALKQPQVNEVGNSGGNSLVNNLLNSLKKSSSSGHSSSTNTHANNIFGGLNVDREHVSSNANIANLLTSFGDKNNNGGSLISSYLLNKITNQNNPTSNLPGLPNLSSLLSENVGSNRVNSASTGDSNTQRPGIPNLASLLSGNSVTSGSSNTQRPGILNLASLLSGNSATTGGFNTQRPGIPSLASILSGNSASTGGSNTQRPEIPNLASLISGNSASTGGTNTQRPGIPNLASLLSSNTASTGGSNSKSSSVSSLTSLLSGNSAAGSDAKPSGLANLASILAGNSAPSSGSNTKQSSLFNLASILSGNSNGLNLGSTSSGSTKPAGLSNLTSMIFGNRVQTNREAPKSATPTPEQSKYLPDMFEYFGGSKPEQLCYPKNCGTLGEMHSQRTTRRIVGGQWTGGIDYWPWMASFRRNFTDDWTYKHVCGAALISERWILTAGHCFMLYRSKAEKVVGQKETNINAFTIHLGAYYRDIAELTLQVFALEKFIAHPEYDFRSLKHDIAVAKLLEPAVINNHVRPICLPFKTNMMEVGATTWVTGWGETLHVGDHNESKLKELPLPLISQYECKNHWKNHFHESWICTEGAYLEDACTGDSGGPLVRQGYDGRWKVVGVAIAGTKRCSTDRTDIRPGIYTNVAYYREFIDSATNGVCH
uniref:uncharacterized protein LOC120326118 isoform X1 n=1 Tax=Styela clava TaxID=7725 RepID=UPI00193A0847|nr:uncharacterized protein LOC120326118 isoform X1 [Styela clava]